MPTRNAKHLTSGLTLFLAVACDPAVEAMDMTGTSSSPAQEIEEKQMAEHPYVGMWVTDDGHIRHELLPNGRYDEARGKRESAYQGRYEVTGTHIEYWDDTGFTADGDFVDENTLHHGGMILRRR
jgi:hypothetical protein